MGSLLAPELRLAFVTSLNQEVERLPRNVERTVIGSLPSTMDDAVVVVATPVFPVVKV